MLKIKTMCLKKLKRSVELSWGIILHGFSVYEQHLLFMFNMTYIEICNYVQNVQTILLDNRLGGKKRVMNNRFIGQVSAVIIP